MRLVIYINSTFEEERALVDLVTGPIIQGDHYHDKVNYKIEGYLKALKDHKIYTEEVPVKELTPDDYVFHKLNFYNATEE